MAYTYISESEAEERYHEMINEVYGELNICGYTYETARVFKEIDPIAYRCGYFDWLDAEELTTDKDR